MTLDEVKSLFSVAGIPVINFHMLANQYSVSDTQERPWWLVETPHGQITIGWRSRVINIDWSLTGYRHVNLTLDDVTKSPTNVHAYDKVKAVVYLSTLYEGMKEERIHKKQQVHTRHLTIDCGAGLDVPGFIINRALSQENIMKLIEAEILNEPEAVDDNRKVPAN